jgi:predicted AAA+ superfamily ATPase
MLEKLSEISHQFLKIKNSSYKRYLKKNTSFSNRMSIIVGQRGVGKTTLLVQLLLEKVGGDRFDPRILYIQADHFVMTNLTLYEIAQEFYLMGGVWLAIDEVHKYSNWSKELKSIYDTFDKLQIFISGTSALEIYKGSHDLSRRCIKYKLQGLSLREYLELTHALTLDCYSLENICQNHQTIADTITHALDSVSAKIIPSFHQYLKYGYYPYYFEIKDQDAYRITLEQNVHLTIESDLVAIYPSLTAITEKKMKQLLSYIADNAPFIPNWSKLLSLLEIGDTRTLKSYFSHLEDVELASSISKASKKFSKLESPDKLYLNNTNQLFAIATKDPEPGTIRETFFLSMLSLHHPVGLPLQGDFLIDQKHLFEIGGKNKTFSQIKNIENSYLALDNIEIGTKTKIPLWLFGFLY